jgi:LysR family transcriptional regulator, transcriptional activator for dmlA
MDSFNDIELFSVIVKLGSMVAAAQELGVTPPVVTKRLAGLEKRLGVRLLNRTTRKISLTPEGEVYLMEGVRLLQEMNSLEGRIGGGSKQPQGTVRIAATLGFGRTHIAPALSEFVREYPQVDVQLHLTDRPVHLVEQGFDLVVRFGELSDSRLTARLLANNKRVICAAPSYLKRLGNLSHPRELGKHNCIFIREGDETFGTWHLSNGQEQEATKVRSNLSTNDGSSALNWALDGQGILLRSQWEVAKALQAKHLIQVLPGWSAPTADIYLVFQSNKHILAKSRVLVDFLLDKFKSKRGNFRSSAGNW